MSFKIFTLVVVYQFTLVNSNKVVLQKHKTLNSEHATDYGCFQKSFFL